MGEVLVVLGAYLNKRYGMVCQQRLLHATYELPRETRSEPSHGRVRGWRQVALIMHAPEETAAQQTQRI